MTSLAVEPIYGSLILALFAIGVTVAVIVMVTPPTIEPVKRRWLIGLRLLAAAVLILALLRPTIVRTDNRPADAALIVAVDTSASMTMPDADGEPRWSTQVDVWKTLAAGIVGHDDGLDVRLIGYDQDTRRFASADAGSLDQQIPDGDATDLQAATMGAIAAAEGQPIAGVVLIGDGAQTAPIVGGGAGRAARTLDSLGVPLWTVPIGPPRGESDSRDVAIDAVPESLQLFAGNQVDINFQVLARGLAGTDLPVRLVWIDAEGNESETAIRSVLARGSVDTVAVTIPITAPPPGTYQLKVSADVQDGELIVTNNEQRAFVDVREGGGRIFYVFGNLDQEQTLIRRALRRFPDLDLTYRWVPTDTASSWPVDFRGAFEPGKYDIYLLGDLHAAALGPQQMQQLADAVDAGAALVMTGGFHSFDLGGYAATPLDPVLPIKLDSKRRRGPSAEPSDQFQLVAPVVARLARTHPITDLGGASPAEAWQDLPSLLGANELVGPKVAPGVEVLLQSEREDPLLVIGQYGSGRVAAVAFDSTWRWWRGGYDDLHRRFWRQLMLWLLARDDSSDDEILLQMDSRRFAADDPASFRAAADADAGRLVAEVIDGDANVLPVDAAMQIGDEAVLSGQLPRLDPGIYRLRVRAGDDQQVAAVERAFQVIDDSRELASPMADPVFLRQLASLTADHGGASFDPVDVSDLVDEIIQRRKRSETPVIEKNRLGDGPWTGWPMFLVFAGCLSAEWWLRRRWGMA
jgi:hypothetical protein